MSQTRIVGAVDIGTSKITVLIGEVVVGHSLNIIGLAQTPAEGIRKGEIYDFKAASHAVHSAILAAESSAGAQIEYVYLSHSGSHLDAFFNTAAVNVTSSDNRVSAADIERVKREAKAKQLPQGRLCIHHIQNPFLLDGRIVADPQGMEGHKLEVGYWTVHADERKLRDSVHVINGFGLNVADIIISSIASGSMVVEDAEKQMGALVLDIGCGTTDFVLYRRGCVVCTGVVPVGGDHLTNDLSYGLRINHANAEKLKLQFAKAFIDPTDKNEKVWLLGEKSIGDRFIARQAIYQIVEARVEELLEIVRKRIEPFLNAQDVAAGVILTGGTSKLPHIDELAARVFNLPARRGENPTRFAENLRGPELSTALGLLNYALTGQDAQEQSRRGRKGGIIRKVMTAIGLAH